MADRTAPGDLLLIQRLVNTLDLASGGDALATDDGLAAFLRTHGLPPGAPADHDAQTVRELREALRAACLAHTGTALPGPAAGTLRRLLSAAPLTVTFDAAGAAALRPAPGLTGTAALRAAIAATVVRTAADGTWDRLKACAAHDCRWVFYDRSPAGRGRWCTMAVCGSRAKMRAYRARRTEPGR